MASKPNSRDRKRLLQSGGQLGPTSANKPARDRSQLPGFDKFPDLSHAAKTPGSQVKKQQSKLNTPTKAHTGNTRDVAGLLDTVLIFKSAQKPSNCTGLDDQDPYDFPADDAADEENRAAAAAVNPANLQQQLHKPAHRQRLQGINNSSPRSNVAGLTSAAGVNNGARMRKMFTSATRQLDLSSGTATGGLGQLGKVPMATDTSTASDVPMSAAAGYSSKWMSSVTGARSKQIGIKSFTVPQQHLTAQYSGSLPAGMVNHGNTCYLNAVLQALLSFKCLSDDLMSSKLQELSLSSSGVTSALQKCLQHHTASGNSERAKGSSSISPAAVSAAMARLDSRWGLCRQEDAHEFLTALLDALQTEVLTAQVSLLKASSGKRSAPASGSDTCTATAGHQADEQAVAAMSIDQDQASLVRGTPGDEQKQQAQSGNLDSAEARSLVPAAEQVISTGPHLGVSAARDPASRNFTGCLQHTLTCSACGHMTTVKEQFNHLSLDLPAPGTTLQQQQPQQAANCSGVRNLLGGVSSPEPLVPELQSLLANFFAPETLEKSCEACKAAGVQHSLQHAVRRLPRVLVVHLKRFQWQVLPEGGAICRKLPTRVKPDYELHLGGVCCAGRPVPPLIAELMPAGLLERAHQAMGIQQAGTPTHMDVDAATQQQQQPPSVGTKRTRDAVGEGDDTAAKDAIHSTDQIAAAASKKPQHQQSLFSAWGNAGQEKVAGKSRLERMKVANGQESHDSPRARHTDLTKLGSGLLQHKPTLGTIAADIEPMVLDDGNEADIEDDAENVSFGNLRRIGSSTALAGTGRTIRDDDEDAELQKALAESMRTHEAELQQRNKQGTVAMPAAMSPTENSALPDGTSSLTAVAAEHDDDLPAWVKQAHAQNAVKAAVAAAAAESLPCTPQSSPKHGFKQSLAGQPVVFASKVDRQPLQPLTDLTGPDDLFRWKSVEQTAEPGLVDNSAFSNPQQAAAGGSGGIGLSGGLAFSDATPAKASGGPASVQQQRRAAGGLFAGLPFLSPAVAGDHGGMMPSSPVCKQPQPVVDGKAPVNGKSNNSSDNSSAMHVDGVAGLAGLSEEEQLALAIQESMKDHNMQQQTGPTAGNSSPVTALPGIDVENYDYEAALQKALEESAAAAVAHAAAAPAEPSAAVVVPDAQAGDVKAEASDGNGDAAAGTGDSEGTEDDTVLVVREVGEDAADRQRPVQARLPLVRLVEDSDCEDDAGQVDGTREQRQQQGGKSEPMDVPEPRQPGNKPPINTSSSTPAAAADSNQNRDLLLPSGKENAENSLQQGAAKAGKSTKLRRPLGEILGNRNANVPANAALSAQEPPVKRPATAAAVAASEAAAAASTAVNGSNDLAATEAAAAAEAVGHWPQENAATYRLRAVVRHKGPLASSGHFVSDVKSNMRDGEWFHYDDSYVQPIRFCNVVRDCQQDGYLFFYVNRAILPVMTGKAPARK